MIILRDRNIEYTAHFTFNGILVYIVMLVPNPMIYFMQ